MKIGVYGGTFNPPHLGHLTAARSVFELLGLDLLLKICNNLTVSPQYLLQGDLCLPDGGEDLRPLVDRLTPHERRLFKELLKSIMKARD